jgi:hypothetical protein
LASFGLDGGSDFFGGFQQPAIPAGAKTSPLAALFAAMVKRLKARIALFRVLQANVNGERIFDETDGLTDFDLAEWNELHGCSSLLLNTSTLPLLKRDAN